MTSLLLASLVVFVAFAAFAIDASLVSNRRQELQIACDAAALAACSELHDPRALYSDDPPSRSAEDLQRLSKLVSNARDAARETASRNRIADSPIRLQQNPNNRPGGDIVLGWVDDPQEEMLAWQRGPLLNSAEVNLGVNGSYRVSLLIGQLLGADHTQISASARATLDRRIYGFRPTRQVSLPMIPILLDRTGEPNPMRLPRDRDQYCFAPRSRRAVPLPDGIKEFTVSLGTRNARRPEKQRVTNAGCQGKAIHFANNIRPDHGLASQIKNGITPGDLAQHQGEIVVGQRLNVSDQTANAEQIAAIATALHRLIGKKRIWPLGNLPGKSSKSKSARTGRVVGFTACQIVAVRATPPNGLQVVLQPCLLTTATALVSPQAREHEFIGKLTLTR